MNDAKQSAQRSEDGEREEPARGPNLILVYGLIVAAMLVAVGIAVMIVLPFYNRR